MEESLRDEQHASTSLSLLLSCTITFVLIFFCPIAIADYKIGLRFSVYLCIHLRALSRSHFLIDFQQNWHRRKNPNKEKRVY